MRVAATVHAPCAWMLFCSELDFSAGVNSIYDAFFFEGFKQSKHEVPQRINVKIFSAKKFKTMVKQQYQFRAKLLKH